MQITSHFFLNFSLLTIILFAALIWAERYVRLSNRKIFYIFWIAIMLFVCFQFSYHPNSEYFFDLRMIPVVLGGLYLGIGPLLIILVIILRAFYGINYGFFLHTGLYLMLGILFWRIQPFFWKLAPPKRICYSVIVTLIISVLTISAMEIMTTIENHFDAWFAFLAIPALGVGMTAYIIEFVMKNTKMQRKMIQAEKMDAVEQMGAAISHEIRNPLTAAIGFVDLLKDPSLPASKRIDYLAIVRDELESAERVIQNYLTFSKPALHLVEEIHIKTELQKVINMLKPTANQNSVEISEEFALLGSIEGDRQKFHQCFLNVMKNSIESMPRGGYLHIETQYTKSHIKIIIIDNGIGMSEEQIARLGEPYYSTKGAKGTGLGMMVVFSIVRAMKGTIQVKSKPSEGSVFTFTFPAYNLSQLNKMHNSKYRGKL